VWFPICIDDGVHEEPYDVGTLCRGGTGSCFGDNVQRFYDVFKDRVARLEAP
jgi:hypothetical protein